MTQQQILEIAKEYLKDNLERDRLYEEEDGEGAFELECEMRDESLDMAEYIISHIKDSKPT
jgi:hypothetical protein